MAASKVTQSRHVQIVGAGLFGLTTALELAQRGYKVLVLDRDLPPVPDGSSVDISRVIRPDYADEFYAKMGLEAMEGWNGEYAPHFHRSGLLCLAQGNAHSYLEGSRRNLEKSGLAVESLESDRIRERCPAIQGKIADTKGYLNPISGWADAHQSIQAVARKCASAGVSFLTGPEGTVVSLLKDGKKIVALKTRTGSLLQSDLVILATGAWTPHLIDMDNISISTCQPVGFIQLTEKEAETLKDIPVLINLSTGWFIFPPTPGTRILKMARHGYGYETTQKSDSRREIISAPMLSSNNAKSGYIPVDAESALREGLATFFPQLKGKAFSNARLCWYSDTPKGDFIVDYHPDFENLFLATGGSGHAFKFLPVLGRYVANGFEGTADEHQTAKWKFKRSTVAISHGDGSRGGPPRRVLNRGEQAKL